MPSVMINVPPTSSRVTRYNSWVSYVCGLIQMAVGALCIVINSVGIFKLPNIFYIGVGTQFYLGHGIWGGISVRFIPFFNTHNITEIL